MGFPLKRTSFTQNFPFPYNEEIVCETPPCLVWVPKKDTKKYIVTVKDEAGNVIFKVETDKNYAYDKSPWKAGKYFWNVTADDGSERGELVFQISDNAIEIERPCAKEVFDSVPENIRPRHLFTKDDITELLSDHKQDFEILKQNVKMALEHGMPEPPKYHHGGDALPYREYFGIYRDYCDRDMIACCLMYTLTGDEEAGEYAKKLLLNICDMNPLGPCSLMGEWGDEVGLSNARCLPAAFDMMYELLNERQRRYVASTVAIYARQCEARIKKINYPENPSNSHVGRIPAYLGEAALVLKGMDIESDETLISWLDTALDIYNGIFPFYGCRDGSWAEGAFYSTSYTKWYLPFFSLVERFSGKSLFTRPFYMRYTQYLIHFCNAKYENHPFGDGYWCHPTDEEWPGFFAQNPYRVYADRFGPELARQRMKEVGDTDYFRLHLLDIFLPKPKRTFENTITGDVKNCAIFKDGGFAAMHTDINAENDICVLVRASRYNADSHRHADQGSFALYCGGKALISPSGYFGRTYGSKHHFGWTQNTIAHNVALIDGKGQKKDVNAIGVFTYYDPDKITKVDMQLEEAYENVDDYHRSILLSNDTKNGGMLLTDTIICQEESSVIVPLHTLVRPEIRDGCVIVKRENCELTIIVEGDIKLKDIKDEYDIELNEGVPKEYQVTMPQQYHIYYETPKAKKHSYTIRFEVNVLD